MKVWLYFPYLAGVRKLWPRCGGDAAQPPMRAVGALIGPSSIHSSGLVPFVSRLDSAHWRYSVEAERKDMGSGQRPMTLHC